MKNIILSCVVASLVIPATGFAQSQPVPTFPNPGQPVSARAGACYAVTLRPATYTTRQQQVVKEDGYNQYAITPAEIGPDRVRSIETRPGYTAYRVVEPAFEPYSTTEVTRPAYETLEAPQVRTGVVNDSYVVREPRLVWRKGANLSGIRRVDSATGDIYCLVEEAAGTVTVTRTVRSAVGDVVRRQVPAREQVITRYRQTRQAGYEAYQVAPATQNVVYNEVLRPASSSVRAVAPVMTTINIDTLATDERYELVEVACDTSSNYAPQAQSGGTSSVARSTVTTPGHVVSLRSVQTALRSKGLYRGPIDGIMGSETTHALRTFQRQNGISGSSLLSIETLRRLGL